MESSKPILVTGTHRSGSTWVGKVLSKASGYGYMHEPFNPIYPSTKQAPISKWFLHLDQNSSSGYHKYFESILGWNYLPFERVGGINNHLKLKLWVKYSIIYALNSLLRRNVLIKDPIAFFSAPWMHNNFDCDVCIVVRHPAAFYYSLKRKNWYFPFEDLSSQKILMENYLADFKDEIFHFAKHKQPLLNQACLFWNIINHTTARYKNDFPNWKIVLHEQLSEDPKKEFHELFRSLNLKFTRKVEEYLEKVSSESNSSVVKGEKELMKRNSKENIKYWKEFLSIKEIDTIRELTSDFWPLFYSDKDW